MSSKKSVSASEKAFKYLRQSPRLNMNYLKDNPGAKTAARRVTSVHNKAGQSHKEIQIGAKPPLGWIFGDFFKPWQRRFPGEPMLHKDIHLRREYPPLSLLELQRLIDLGWINTSTPIDLTTLCNTFQYKCNPAIQQFGVQLTDQGADIFQSRVHIEVQWASEMAIAAVERLGGTIVTAYFDPVSLNTMINPMKHFEKGEPIPKRGFPPADIMDYYTDPHSRGYLANPVEIEECKKELAQKFGYEIPNKEELEKDSPDMWKARKDPLQIFYGLEPGWVVNLRDKCILKPKDEELVNFYKS